MIGVLVNTAAVIIGGLIGLIFKNGIPEKITKAVMTGIGLCVIYIGISGALKGKSTLVLIVSMIIGTAVGSLIDLDDKINRLGAWIESKFSVKGKKISIAQGFVTGSLFFCVGSMAVVGSLNAGLLGDNTMLYTKSLLDFISAIMFAASIGLGVIFSSAFVFIFQGAIVLLAELLSNVMTSSAIAEMTCAGSVIIIALGFNIVGISKLKVANYMPAIILAPIFCRLFELLPFSI